MAMKPDDLYEHFAGCALIAAGNLLTWERMVAFSEDHAQAQKMAQAIWKLAGEMVRAKPVLQPLPVGTPYDDDEEQP